MCIRDRDCSAATENLLLAAHACGLGAVWCGLYPDMERVQTARTILRLDERYVPLCIIPVGYPSAPVSPKDKYREDAIIRRWSCRFNLLLSIYLYNIEKLLKILCAMELGWLIVFACFVPWIKDAFDKRANGWCFTSWSRTNEADLSWRRCHIKSAPFLSGFGMSVVLALEALIKKEGLLAESLSLLVSNRYNF